MLIFKYDGKIWGLDIFLNINIMHWGKKIINMSTIHISSKAIFYIFISFLYLNS